MTVERGSDLDALASLLSCRAFAALACDASLALLAFFSLINCKRGVVVTLSDLCSRLSAPFAGGFVIGSVKLCKKSINSWS